MSGLGISSLPSLSSIVESKTCSLLRKLYCKKNKAMRGDRVRDVALKF